MKARVSMLKFSELREPLLLINTKYGKQLFKLMNKKLSQFHALKLCLSRPIFKEVIAYKQHNK